MSNQLSPEEILDIKDLRNLKSSWADIANKLNKSRKREYTATWYREKYIKHREESEKTKIIVGRKYETSEKVKHYMPGSEYKKDTMTCIKEYKNFYLFETSRGIKICISENDNYDLKEVNR